MKKIILLILILSSFQLMAQEEEPTIFTDRPGFSDASRTVPKGFFQIENGFFFETETISESASRQFINFNSSLIRYGLTNGLELRLNQSIWADRVLENSRPTDLGWQNGIAPLMVGIKVNLLEEDGIIPEVAFVTDYTFAKSSGYFENPNSELRFNLIALHRLSNDWIFTYNVGLDRILGLQINTLTYTVKTAYTFNKFSPYFELYGFRSQVATPLNYMNGGISYLLNNKLQVDLHGGIDIVQLYNNNLFYNQSFISMGFSYMFPIIK